MKPQETEMEKDKKRMKPINKGAQKLKEQEVVGMADDDVMTSMPIGCTTVFDTGWETNPRPTVPVGNCVSSARDFTTCAGPCWWPAQTPDGVTNNVGFHNQCLAVERDWKKLNFIIKR